MAKFYSSEDVRRYADDFKADFQNKFKNQNFPINPNINLNQNINILYNNTINTNSNINNNTSKNNFYSPSKMNTNNNKNSNIKTFKLSCGDIIDFTNISNNKNSILSSNKPELIKNYNKYPSKYKDIKDNNLNKTNSRFDEIDNNFFLESEKIHASIKNNSGKNFSNEDLKHKNNSYLFNVFQNQNLNQRFGYYSHSNSPWRSGHNFYNNPEIFSLNNSFSNDNNTNFTRHHRNHINFYTPGNSPGKMKQNPNFPYSLNSNYQTKNSNFSSKQNKASLFNNFTLDKDEKGDDFTDLADLLDTINCELWLYASSQKGSRNLQKLLNKILPHELDIILEQIKEHFAFLMTDIYGNYFCQKLIQCCSSEKRVFILKHVNFIFYIN